MKVTLFQDTIAWADKKANFQRVEACLKELAGTTDLVVLPEMFSTGFCVDRMELAETMQEKTVALLKRWAVDYGVALCGSFMATEGGRYYNRAFFVYPTGELLTADKRHLFAPGGEGRIFSAGDRRLLVRYKDFNICVLVCYDLRFPVWSRNVENAYDLLLYVANWPESRIKAWNVLLEARAIENQAYVCGVNRIGTDGDGIRYTGHSKLINAKGQEISALLANHTHIETVDISKEELEEFRHKFPAWKDADRFDISSLSSRYW